jgi:hypothetical protein
MHGLSLAPVSWSVASVAPRRGLSLCASSLRAADCKVSRRRRQLETAFRSPPAAIRFRTSSGGSQVLACFFATRQSTPQIRSARNSFPLPVSGTGEDHRSSPVIRALALPPRCCSGLAPLWDRNPAGSSLALVCHRGTYHCERPISSHSPKTTVKLFPDHRYRFASYRLARCSSNGFWIFSNLK